LPDGSTRYVGHSIETRTAVVRGAHNLPMALPKADATQIHEFYKRPRMLSIEKMAFGCDHLVLHVNQYETKVCWGRVAIL
jgi:4-hydroxyphenylpyruvate dioxygenase-like putative hemolysin